MISCADVAKHVCENLDEQLNSPLCRQIKKHLQECPNCAGNLANLKKTIAPYKKVPEPCLPESAYRNLLSVLKIK